MTDTLPTRYGQEPNVRLGITFDEIVSLARQRRSQDSLMIRQMIDARDRYNGDVVLPLPDVNGAPDMEPPTPRLIAEAIDGSAMRASSPNPQIVVPTLGSATNLAVRRADIRRRALYAAWEDSQLRIKLYRSYRHLVGYGTNCWVVIPDDGEKIAKIELRDPLTAYPELRNQDDIREPRNVIFIYGRSIDWIIGHYPNTRGFFYNAANRNWDTLWDIVEYIDQDEIVIGILGPRMPAYSPQDARPYGYNGFELCRFRNRAGMVPVVCPRRVTLDRIQGQMATMVGSVDLHARLTALELAAAEKHVFPDLVMLSEPNQIADVASGNWEDGRTGNVNIVRNARGVQYLTNATPPFVPEMVQGLEDSIRESGGASSMFGGQNPNSLRTGRAIDVMGSFAIDPRVEEAQRIQAKAMTVLNEAWLEVERGYFPNKKYVLFTGLPGDNSTVEFTPSKDFDDCSNVVMYPIPGADVSQMSVAISQLVGSRLMSLRTGRVKHPFIDDADLEERQIAGDAIEAALIQGAAQQIATGAMPITDAARVKELMDEGKTLTEALQTAQKEAQERQAAQAPPPQPGQNTAPGQQPGLSLPGNGVEQGPPGQGQGPIPVPPQSLANFHSLIRNLNSQPSNVPTGGPPGA